MHVTHVIIMHADADGLGMSFPDNKSCIYSPGWHHH